MRLWRFIVPLVLAFGVLAMPALAAKKKAAKAPKPAPVARVAKSAAKPDSLKAPAARPKHSSLASRRAWMIGFGYGYGSAAFAGTGHEAFSTLDPTGFSTSTREFAPLLQFRLGYAIRPSLAVSLERNSWSKTINGDTWTLGVTTVSYTWYPKAGRFFLRGGLGVGDAVDKEVLNSTTGANIKHQDDGFGAVGEIGYEWQFLKRISICPEIGASYMSLDNKVFADYGSASLALSWWF
jgi:uncharacterized protein with beta-barrel porin domain